MDISTVQSSTEAFLLKVSDVSEEVIAKTPAFLSKVSDLSEETIAKAPAFGCDMLSSLQGTIPDELSNALNQLREKLTNKSNFAINAWKHAEYLCKNYILNGLDNTLYNVYSSVDSAKNLWTSLEKKYKTEVAGTKKFIVGKFLDYKMVDSKIVISQV